MNTKDWKEEFVVEAEAFTRLNTLRLDDKEGVEALIEFVEKLLAAKEQEFVEKLEGLPEKLAEKVRSHYPEEVWPSPPPDKIAKDNVAAQLMRTLGANVAKYDLIDLLQEYKQGRPNQKEK